MVKARSTVLIVLAALCWGLSGGIGSLLMAAGWDVLVASFYRGAIGLLCVFIWLILCPLGNGLTSPWLWLWAIIAGIGVAGNFTFYFLSISHGNVAVAATLMYCAPVFVYLVSFALKLEKPTALKWTAIVLVMPGILLLTQLYRIGTSNITLTGIGAGLLAGLSYALFVFGFKYAAAHGSPQAILSIAFAVLVIILIGPSDGNQIASALGSVDWPLFASLGALGAGVSFVLYLKGLNQTTPAIAAIVAMVEPVTASLVGVIMLNEILAGPQILGMVLILAAVTALSVCSNS